MENHRAKFNEDSQFGSWLRTNSRSGRGIKGSRNSSVEYKKLDGHQQPQDPKNTTLNIADTNSQSDCDGFNGNQGGSSEPVIKRGKRGTSIERDNWLKCQDKLSISTSHEFISNNKEYYSENPQKVRYFKVNRKEDQMHSDSLKNSYGLSQ